MRRRTHAARRLCRALRSASTWLSSRSVSSRRCGVPPRADGSCRSIARRAASCVRASCTAMLRAHHQQDTSVTVGTNGLLGQPICMGYVHQGAICLRPLDGIIQALYERKPISFFMSTKSTAAIRLVICISTWFASVSQSSWDRSAQLAALSVSTLLLLSFPKFLLHAEERILIGLRYIGLKVKVLRTVLTVWNRVGQGCAKVCAAFKCGHEQTASGAVSTRRLVRALRHFSRRETGYFRNTFVPPPHLRTAVGAAERVPVANDSSLSL